ncbi:MAG: riboflavin biosynthesis protein RibF [Lachnospiraceae bacterium]|nr:riboflavin biosynthesis protein RibF [Lachnospiraceae bacterium]
MEIISGTKDIYINGPSCVAIGKFDGVHIGHQSLLMEITGFAKSHADEDFKSCVFTFDPAPEVFFGGDSAVLTTPSEKRILFERKGIDILIEYPFDKETADTEPLDFLSDLIVGRIGAVMMAAGSDLSFGKKGLGNAELLTKYGKENGIDVSIIDKLTVSLDKEYEVSSTLIRQMVTEARMEEAEKLLGIPYFICGKIVHGNHMGRELGFPTINVIPDENKLLPPNGVYTSDVIIDGKKYFGLTNIGKKPTISDHEVRGVETFIYDFDGDVYGRDAEIYLKHFCRPETKFESLDALKDKLASDIEKYRP